MPVYGTVYERYAYAIKSTADHAHSRGLRKTSINLPSSVPFEPMSDMYSHRAVSGRLFVINKGRGPITQSES